jgi:hypothetical protein
MSHNSLDINVLVNGNRCKQYRHNSLSYIESKDGSNYTLEIKNNSSTRILVVASVDGLNVLDGKLASPQDFGYVVDAYSKCEIKGFRYSDDNVGAFEFTRKNCEDGYAATKGSQSNVGVIGFRVYEELNRPPIVIKEYVKLPYYPYPVWPTPHYPYKHPEYNWYKITCSDDPTSTLRDTGGTSDYGVDGMFGDTVKCSNCSDDTGGVLRSINKSASEPSLGYDMATKWGQKIESKVKSVEFERGTLIHSLDVYYASRLSLIQMGVPLSNELKISTPQSFPNRYAEPPKGWQG